MTRWEVGRVIAAVLLAAAIVLTGIARLPSTKGQPFSYPPTVVYSDHMLAPLVVTAHRVAAHLPRHPGRFARAPAGKPVPVSITQYCLQGTTRRDHWVREGIVAADPRVFPLARYVEVFTGNRYLGRFLVDDTGSKVKGRTLDIWNPSCSEARKFGRRHGTAMLVMKPEH